MASSHPATQNPTARRPFQFTLRGLMVLTFGVAVGASAATAKSADWGDGLLTAVSAWFVIGLLNEAWDLWRGFPRGVALSRDQRWGWRFAIFWRLGVACLLVGHYIVSRLLEMELLSLPADMDFGFYAGPTGDALRRAVFYVLSLIVLYSGPQAAHARPRSAWSWGLDAIGAAVGLVLALMVWSYMMLIPHLVQIALIGVEVTFPLGCGIDGIDIDIVARWGRFLCWSLAAVGLAAVDLALVCRLSRQWVCQVPHTWIWAALLALGLAFAIPYPVWVCSRGFHGASPWMAEAFSVGPLYRWLSAALLVVVLVTAAAYRLARTPDNATAAVGDSWSRCPSSYYHQRRMVRAVLVAALLLKLALAAYSYFTVLRPRGLTMKDLLEEWLLTPPFNLPAAVFLLALRNVVSGWFRTVEVQPACPPALSPTRFCVVWIALLIVLVVAVPAMAALSAGVWLLPWYCDF